jgi:tetratricopeptide (TPR) repeat protein
VQSFVVFQDRLAGRGTHADELADKTMAIAERLGHLGSMFMLLDDRAREHVKVADIAAVEAAGLRIVDTCQRGGLPWRSIGHSFVGLAAHLRGDASRADAEFRQAVEFEPPGAFAGQAASLWVRHLAQAGRADEVLALYESERSAFPEVGGFANYGTWNSMLGLVEALYLTGHRQEAASLSPLIEEALETGPEWSSFDCRFVRTRAAVAAAASCRWEDAERHFAVAEEQALRTSNTLEAVDLLRLRARMLLDRGRPDDDRQAAELLAQALDDYRRLGMPGYSAEVERMLEQAALRR